MVYWYIFFCIRYDRLHATAPAHLKYFGFTAIDCFYDDPLDASSITNYITEVDSFSNIAHMCVYDYTDDVVARTLYMNSFCVIPIMHIQNVFFYYANTLAPSGSNYNLYPDYLARWKVFKNTNASILNETRVGCFYLADEPFWNGIPLSEMNLVSSLVKNDFPAIPLLMVEAYTSVNTMEVPTQMDWVGFDRYGEFDPNTSVGFQNDLITLKTKLSSPSQKIMLIIDDQWYPDYLTYLGWTQDTMAYVVQNYYDLAASDPSIIGLIGYIWPGGLDAPTHHGVRNLTSAVINKNVAIGQAIKANYNPCVLMSNEVYNPVVDNKIKVYPNPAVESVTIELEAYIGSSVDVYNMLGERMLPVSIFDKPTMVIKTINWTDGMYVAVIKKGDRSERVVFLVGE